jgi:exonuclease III
LKLALFNVENLFIYPDKNENDDLYLEKSEQKLNDLKATIENINPDLLMLCEVGGIQSLDYFNEQYLNAAYRTSLIEGNSDRGIENAYLIKKTLPLDFKQFSHKDTPINFNYAFEIEQNQKSQRQGLALKYQSHKFSRDISELRLYKRDSSSPSLIILLVHLKSKMDEAGIDPKSKGRRKAELITLIDTYKKLNKTFKDVPIIIAGDFNGIASKNNYEEEFEYLYFETNLEDILDILNTPIEDRTTLVYFKDDHSLEYTQFDYIFLPPELKDTILREKSGIYPFIDSKGNTIPFPTDGYLKSLLPSDHYPICVDLDFSI